MYADSRLALVLVTRVCTPTRYVLLHARKAPIGPAITVNVTTTL